MPMQSVNLGEIISLEALLYSLAATMIVLAAVLLLASGHGKPREAQDAAVPEQIARQRGENGENDEWNPGEGQADAQGAGEGDGDSDGEEASDEDDQDGAPDAAALMNMGDRARAIAVRRRERAHRREMIRDMRGAMQQRKDAADQARLQRMEERDEAQAQEVLGLQQREAAARQSQETKLWKALESLGLQRSDCLTSVAPDGSLHHRAPPAPTALCASSAPPALFRSSSTARSLTGSGTPTPLSEHEQVLGACALTALRGCLPSRTPSGSSGFRRGSGVVAVELSELSARLLHGQAKVGASSPWKSAAAGMRLGRVPLGACLVSRLEGAVKAAAAGGRGLGGVLTSMLAGVEGHLRGVASARGVSTGVTIAPRSTGSALQSSDASSLEAGLLEGLGSDWFGFVSSVPSGRLVGCWREDVARWRRAGGGDRGGGSSRGNEGSASSGGCGKEQEAAGGGGAAAAGGQAAAEDLFSIDLDAMQAWLVQEAAGYRRSREEQERLNGCH